MEKTDCIVIGAGVVGLAVARKLAQSDREVVILEGADRIGTEASSRTGEVVHAGIHYPSGSLRARLCVEGRDMVYAYCQHQGINHRMTGEMVTAGDRSQWKDLEKLMAQALANGILDVRLLDKGEAMTLEPGLACSGALISPTTGIIDSHALMKAFLADAVGAGAVLALNTPVLAGKITGHGIEISHGGSETGTISCDALVNCSGIHAQQVAARLQGFDPVHVPDTFLCKGSYFITSKAPPISRLVFSLPSGSVPGIHMSLDLAGQARFGPDSQWTNHIDYHVDPTRELFFASGIKRYWPGLPDGALHPGFAGYFARTYGPANPVADWIIQGPDVHGVDGLVNLFGIDSPGLTACMAIAEEVVKML